MTVYAAKFPSGTFYDVCFTPQQNCALKIVNQIRRAKSSILVQSYSFTSKWIAFALIKAHDRGVQVKVILDKSQFDPQNFSMEGYLIQHGIPVWEDYQLNIAHNKVMIFDESTVETGSYNYTTSAQKYNAENILIIDNKMLAQKYIQNWQTRRNASKLILEKRDG